MAARVVGIRQEGESLPDGAVHEVRGQLHDVTSKVQSARAVSCRAGAACNWKKKIKNKSKPRFRVNRIPWAGVKDPLSGGTG